ncbi:MAG: hypothetical protein MJK12_21525 [Colwellia sp.]|nr:hypothetical protein [Colwellia sp.]
MKYLTFVLLILFSFEAYSSVEMIDEHKLTNTEYNKLGFFKIVNSTNDEPNAPSQIIIIYPKKLKSNFQVTDVFLEVKDDKGIILETWLKTEDADHDLLSVSVINLIKPSVISISVNIKYIKFGEGTSISSGHLIKLGNLDLLSETTYSNYLQWKYSP